VELWKLVNMKIINGVAKRSLMFWLVVSIVLFLTIIFIMELWFYLGFPLNWSIQTNLIIAIALGVFLFSSIIVSTTSVFFLKKYRLLRYMPIVITVISVILFPFGWATTTIEFNRRCSTYLQIVDKYKHNQLILTYKKTSDWVNLPQSDTSLSTGGSIKVQRNPLTLLFYKERETEDVTGILYREGSISSGSLEDSTSLTHFLYRDFHARKICDNWYWLETFSNREKAP
jgi:hypothetical protein